MKLLQFFGSIYIERYIQRVFTGREKHYLLNVAVLISKEMTC